jgi:hypothetical protein
VRDRPATVLKVNAVNTTAPSTIATPSFRPEPGESAPYHDRYISLVAGNDILATLDEQRRQTLLLLCGRSEADGDLRYLPEKWSLKEVLGHINDTERIMSYRALRIARGDKTPLPGFEDWIEDYIAVRRATLTLFRHLDQAAWTRRGVASNHEVTVRALAYIIAGHELHHRKIIEEKYLK